jgi:hypothetical protein
MQAWCYVDPCNCDDPDIAFSDYFAVDTTSNGFPLFYSYGTCGREDMYTCVGFAEDKCTADPDCTLAEGVCRTSSAGLADAIAAHDGCGHDLEYAIVSGSDCDGDPTVGAVLTGIAAAAALSAETEPTHRSEADGVATSVYGWSYHELLELDTAQYTVCARWRTGGDWYPAADSDATSDTVRFLHVREKPATAVEPADGPQPTKAYTAAVGGEVEMTLAGVSGTAYLGFSQAGAAVAITDVTGIEDGKVAVDIDGLTPGSYGVSLCTGSDAKCQHLQNHTDVALLRVVSGAQKQKTYDLAKHYVVTPETESSLEVIGSELSPADRILLTDCTATCGSADGEIFAPVESRIPPWVDFVEVEERYCVGTDLAAVPTTYADANRCVTKCPTCEGDGCFCEDFLDDDVDPSTLCLPRFECEAACAELEECYAVNMHATKPRCTIQTTECASQVASLKLGSSWTYSLLLKRETESEVRRLERELLLSTTPSTHSTVLRFPGVTLAAGRYKVCFCDSALGNCASPAAYDVEVGLVHASGISCLLSEPRLRNVDCVSQFHGGLRCADRQVTAPVHDGFIESYADDIANN